MTDTHETNTMDFAEICRLLPHRTPFLLIDRVLEFEAEKSLHGIKCVSNMEPFFPGHFPDNPVFPGVLQIEGMAQAAALLLFRTFEVQNTPIEKKCVLTSVDEARFRRIVVPGDVMHYHVHYERRRGVFVWFRGEVCVDGEVAAEARFSAMFFPQNAAGGAQ